MDKDRKGYRHIVLAGYGATIFVILAAIGIISFAFIKNEDIITHLHNQPFIMAFNAAIWFIIILVTSLMMILFITASIKMFKQVIEAVLANKGTVNMQDGDFLKLLSIFLMIIIYTVIPDMEPKQWFGFLDHSKGITPILKGTLLFMVGLLLYLAIYKILDSLVRPDSTLRYYITKISRLLITTAGDLAVNFLELLGNIPCLFQWIIRSIPKSIAWLGELFFDEEDEADKAADNVPSQEDPYGL